MNELSETLEKTISELKTSNNELKRDIEKKEKLNSMRLEFLSNIAHELKTKAVEQLKAIRIAHFRPQDTSLRYSPEPLFQNADYLRNIINEQHRAVYEDFGAKSIEYGLDKTEDYAGKSLMTCKYCLRYELGWCKKNTAVSSAPKEPLYLVSGTRRFRLEFDCGKCEMKVMG